MSKGYCQAHNRPWFTDQGCMDCKYTELTGNTVEKRPHKIICEKPTTLTCDLKDGKFTNGRRSE